MLWGAGEPELALGSVLFSLLKPDDSFPLSSGFVDNPFYLWTDESDAANALLLSLNSYSFPKVTLRKHLTTKPFSPAIAHRGAFFVDARKLSEMDPEFGTS